MIDLSTHDQIRTITINNPSSANALTEQMLHDLVAAFNEASADPKIRAVLLKAAGGRGFSAGMDTSQFEHDSAIKAHETITLLGNVHQAVKFCQAPVAVAIEGYCIGGSMGIVAAADFRVAAKNAWFSMPEAQIGFPSVLESVNYARLMGWTLSSEMMLTGRRYAASDLKNAGFLNAVTDTEGLEKVALEYLKDCMRADREVIAQQKRLFHTWRNLSEQAAYSDSRHEFTQAYARLHS